MGDSWEGVYHHSDGYPSGLGCYLFRLVRHQYGGDADALVNMVVQHDGGWSHLYPSSVMTDKGFSKSKDAPQCYCHGAFARRDKIKPGGKSWWQTAEQHNWDLEWVYVFDVRARRLAVLRHDMGPCPNWKDNKGKVGLPSCCEPVALLDLDGVEPRWRDVECGSELERCGHRRAAHDATVCDRCDGKGVVLPSGHRVGMGLTACSPACVPEPRAPKALWHGDQPDPAWHLVRPEGGFGCQECGGSGRATTVRLLRDDATWADSYLPPVVEPLRRKAA